jgi:hypothetical protein
VVNLARHVFDGHGRPQGDRVRVDLARPAGEDPDQAAQPPDGPAEGVDAGIVEDGDGHELELRIGAGEAIERVRRRLVCLRSREEHRWRDPGRGELGADCIERLDRSRELVAQHDGVGTPKNAEKGSTAAAALGGPFDQAGDLDELDQHPFDSRQRRNRPRRREGVVAGLDLDVGESLQERRLARVRRPDERDLRRPFTTDRDRITVDDPRPRSRRLQLGVHPLANVGVRAAPVVRKAREDRAQLADPLGAFLADEAALDHLHLRAMRHGHRDTPSQSCGKCASPGRAAYSVASCPAASSDA